MAINNVNTTSEEKSYKFLKNQSSILRTVSTNNITINGVNVIVAKPKVGDIMCVTRYKGDDDTLLSADKQKVIWIDGLSIEPKQLSTEFEPVGICVVVNGDKAIVRYRKEFTAKWISINRYKIPDDFFPVKPPMQIYIKLNGQKLDDVSLKVQRAQLNKDLFVSEFNNTFSNKFVTAEHIQQSTLNTPEDNDSVIINYRGTVSFEINGTEKSLQKITNNHVTSDAKFKQPGNNGFYLNTDCYGTTNYNPFTCYAVAYDELKHVPNATGDIENINTLVNKTDFENTNSSYCDILRSTFTNYDDYVESLIVKYPCGVRSEKNSTKSGKDNTSKLANYTFLTFDGQQTTTLPLYIAAYLTSSIDVNAPNLTKGNWWIPSPDEMTQIMSNITYNTSLWDSKPDIVNSVIEKINNDIGEINEENHWSILDPYGASPSNNKWLPIKDGSSYMMFYNSYSSTIDSGPISLFDNRNVMPITIYDI